MGVGEGREICFPDHNYIVKELENVQTGRIFIIIWCADPAQYWLGGIKDIANILKHFVSFFLSVLFIWFPAISFP